MPAHHLLVKVKRGPEERLEIPLLSNDAYGGAACRGRTVVSSIIPILY